MSNFQELYTDNAEAFEDFIEKLHADTAGDDQALAGVLELFMDRLCEEIDAVNGETEEAL